MILISRSEDALKTLRRALCRAVLREIDHQAFACPLGGPPYCHPRDVGKYKPRGFISMWDLEAAARVLESGRRYIKGADLYVSCLVCDLLGPVGRGTLNPRTVERIGGRTRAVRLSKTGVPEKDGLVRYALNIMLAREGRNVELKGDWKADPKDFLRFAEEANDLIETLSEYGCLGIPRRPRRSPAAFHR